MTERIAPPERLAGPVENGSTTSTADWANYLMGFAAWGPPLAEAPHGWSPTIANVAVGRASVVDALRGPPGTLERAIIPQLWRQHPVVVEDAVVAHTQSFSLPGHVANHFRDCRHAGAHERRSGGAPRFLRPGALRTESRRWLRLASAAVGPRPHLPAVHRRAAWHLRSLALARAIGLAVGSRLGAGRSHHRLD